MLYPRRPAKPQQPKPPDQPAPLNVLALAELKANEIAELPLGGYAGEMLVPRPAEPGIVYGPALTIPKPDWEAERLEREAREREERIAEAAALLESVEPPRRPDAPAPKRGREDGV